MTFFHAVILGVVEGISEFLPVSSTFHLIITSILLDLPPTEFHKAFEVIIQSGAILAILVLYWRKIIGNIFLMKNIVISFIPTAIIGMLLYKVIKQDFFENLYLQLFMFMFVGLIFILYEKFNRKKLIKSITDLRYSDALLVGIIQSLAIVPGVSRAGAVMLILMIMGTKRDQAALYSFFLAIPTILAASGYDLVKILPELSTFQAYFGFLITGFISAFISAFFVAKWLIKYLQKNTLSSFGWYRIVFGVILIFLAIVGVSINE